MIIEARHPYTGIVLPVVDKQKATDRSEIQKTDLLIDHKNRYYILVWDKDKLEIELYEVTLDEDGIDVDSYPVEDKMSKLCYLEVLNV